MSILSKSVFSLLFVSLLSSFSYFWTFCSLSLLQHLLFLPWILFMYISYFLHKIIRSFYIDFISMSYSKVFFLSLLSLCKYFLIFLIKILNIHKCRQNNIMNPLCPTLSFSFFFSWPWHTACKILVPWPGIEPGPRQWKCWVLITDRQAKSLQFYPRLCDLVDRSLPGFSVREILQARILEWVVMPSSRESFWPRDQTQVSYVIGRFFTVWATREAH